MFEALTYDQDAQEFCGPLALFGASVQVSIAAEFTDGTPRIANWVSSALDRVPEAAKKAAPLIREWFLDPDNVWATDEDENPLGEDYLDAHLEMAEVCVYLDSSMNLIYIMNGDDDCLWGHFLIIAVDAEGAVEFDGLHG